MSGSFYEAGGVLWAEKGAGEALDYTLDYTEALAGDTIASSTWTVGAGITKSGEQNTTTTASVVLSGGAGGQWYLVSNTVITAGGRTLGKSFRLLITDAAALGTGVQSVFGDVAAAVASLRRDRLTGMLESYAAGATLTDEYLLASLMSAEKTVERELRVFLTPREMVPPSTTQAERDALVAAGNRLENEPGYDYDPALFQGNTWGLIELRQRPAISVSRIAFYYPAPNNLVYDIPLDWVRLDPKTARINLVPTQTVLSVPLNSYILSAIGGGRVLPLMLHVRYRAGLQNAAADYPDLLSVIRRQAMLDILADRFVPASGSVSADGLSQSISFEAAKYQEEVDAKLAKLRSSIHGIRMMVV